MGFFDALCPRCGRRVGWHGEMKDRPECARCGHRVPESAADAAELRRFREFLAGRKPAKPAD